MHEAIPFHNNFISYSHGEETTVQYCMSSDAMEHFWKYHALADLLLQSQASAGVLARSGITRNSRFTVLVHIYMEPVRFVGGILSGACSFSNFLHFGFAARSEYHCRVEVLWQGALALCKFVGRTFNVRLVSSIITYLESNYTLNSCFI